MASLASSVAAQELAARGDTKPVTKVNVGGPRLHYAPDHAHNASHDLTNMSLAQKTLVSMRQQGFFPKAFPSPKFPDLALLSPRMPPSPWSMQAPPRSPRSPGLTELTMSPGPSILLKPTNYGARSPSPAFLPTVQTPQQPFQKQQAPTQQKKKQKTRSAVPSVLLRSLGITAESLAPSSSTTSAEMNRILQASPSSPTPLLANKDGNSAENEAEEPSLTPILDLGIDFGSDPAFQKALELQNDFVSSPMTPAPLTPAPLTPASAAEASSSMAALFMALSPVSAYSSPPPSAALLSTPSFRKSLLPTPPPSAGLPPPPTRVPLTKQPSNASIQSKVSQGSSHSARSFHSAASATPSKGRAGQVSIDMPPVQDDEASFRPLSLGLKRSGRESQSTFNNILGSLRRVPSGSDAIDLETGSLTMTSSDSRSFSSDALSHASSQTSFDVDSSSTSFGKASVVSAGIVPPMPPMPISVLSPGKKAQAQAMESIAPANTAYGRASRKRASTLGALDYPTIVIPDLMHPRAAPVPQIKMEQQMPQVEPIQVQQVGLTNMRAHSTDALPLKSGQSSPMNFASPYHRALYPDPPLDDGHLSPGIPPNSPLLSQFSPKMLDASPSLSPKPSFTESVKARFSLSRKSATSSPANTPRLGDAEQFPVPQAEGSAQKLAPASDAVAKQNGASPTIMFNGEPTEPTRPLRLRKPVGAKASPQLASSSKAPEASPSPIMQNDRWATEPTNSPTPDIFSPLVPDSEAALTPKGERIDFAKFAETSSWREPAEGARSPLEEVGDRMSMELTGLSAAAMAQSRQALPSPLQKNFTAALSPVEDVPTPKPRVMSSFDFDTDYTTHRDSMISVAASTISIASNSTCMTDSVGEDLELAADRRVKLLASVQQNLLKAQAKDAKRESKTAARARISHMPHSSSLKNIPEELKGGVKTLGLGLFEEEEEEEVVDNKATLAPVANQPMAPLTPPLTPVDATSSAKTSGHVQTPSTSSTASSTSSIPISRSRQRSLRGTLAPIDVNAANRGHVSPSLLTPERPIRGDGGSSPSPSLGLRKLNLASSSTVGDGSPMKRFERSALSPNSAPLRSPSPAYVTGQSGRHNEEGRASRSITYRQGGVLPTISSKGAFETSRPAYAHSELSHSESNGSMASSLGSFSSRMGHFPSPVKSSFGNGMSRMPGIRPIVANTRGHSASNSVYSNASTTSMSYGPSSASSTNTSFHNARLGYKTTDLSATAGKPSLDVPDRAELVSALAL